MTISYRKTANLWILTLSSLLTFSVAAHAQTGASSNGFDERLNFNDNQVPAGWTLDISPGGHAEIANKRFQIEQVNSYVSLDRDKVLPNGNDEVHVSFTCSVQNIYWGAGYNVHLVMQDGSDFEVSLGKDGYGNDQIRVYAGDVASLGFDQDFAPDYGTYTLDTYFQNGRISFTALKKGSETPLISTSLVVPELSVSSLKTVQVGGWMTTGGPGWIDNALIEALQSKKTWAGNGHTYEVINAQLTWLDAQTAAQEQGGYMATVTSAAENSFVAKLTKRNVRTWLGAYQPDGVTWTWVNGEPFTYTNWAPGEPNNLEGIEDYLQIYGTTGPAPGQWNDAWYNSPTPAYVVEYDSMP